MTFSGAGGPMVWMDAPGREVQVPQNRNSSGIVADVSALLPGVYGVRVLGQAWGGVVEQ